MRERLEFMADRIEAVLSLHHIPGRVTGGTVTPRWIRFQVLPVLSGVEGPALGTKMSKIKELKEELAVALDAPNCRVSRRGAAVDIEVPRDDPLPVRLLPLYRQLDEEDSRITGIPPLTGILGLADDGTPLLVRLPSPDVAHILIAGTEGAGKTALLQATVLSLAMTNPAPSPLVTSGGLALMLVDFNGHAFGHFEDPLASGGTPASERGMPHMARPVICEIDEAVEALQSLVRLMDRRTRVGESDDKTYLDREPCTIIAIDELADLLAAASGTVFQALIRLTQGGREAGIHVIAATREVTVLQGLSKANFPVRLVGRVTNVSDARVATGWSGTGAERLMGRGDFLAVAEGRVVRFQAAYVSPEEIQEVVTYLAQGETLVQLPSVPWPVNPLAQVFRGAQR
jgi:S-DNA-T family DNA segregation ATPase FtsK/SpoIIIE